MSLIGETYGICNLRDGALSAFQQVGGLPQAQVADEVACGESCHLLHLAVQMGSAESYFRASISTLNSGLFRLAFTTFIIRSISALSFP